MDAAAIVAFMIMLLLCVYFMRAFIDQRINYFESFLYSLFPFPSFFFFFLSFQLKHGGRCCVMLNKTSCVFN
jgi:hypothetical protein